jgi:hypothetical protein
LFFFPPKICHLTKNGKRKWTEYSNDEQFVAIASVGKTYTALAGPAEEWLNKRKRKDPQTEQYFLNERFINEQRLKMALLKLPMCDLLRKNTKIHIFMLCLHCEKHT